MRKILITGGAGNVASSLADRLLDTDKYEVVIVDNLSTGNIEKVPLDHPKCSFIEADTNVAEDIKNIFQSHKFDIVFHYAALVGVQRTLDNPDMVLRDIDGFRIILEESSAQKVGRYFFSSSSEVYGEPVEIPQYEDSTPLNAKLPYAIVKNVGEAYAKTYQQMRGLPYTIFRFFNTYGPKQSTDFVISKFIDAALSGDEITVYGDGMQTRTFCYIDDNTESTLKILEQNHLINETANLGNDHEMTILDLAKHIIDILGSSSKVIHLPALPAGDMKRRCPDISKMRKILQRDLIPLEEGVLKTAEYIKKSTVKT